MKAFPTLAAILVAAIALCSFPAASHGQDTSARRQSQDSSQKQELKTFVGTVIKEGDSYVLKEEASNLTYKLDDQQKAKANEGKAVKVQGTLDSISNTIQVSSVEPKK